MSSSEQPSLALSGLNVVFEDETEYVFVDGDLQGILDGDDGLDEWEDDDESYDRCDLSPSLSCATSVATNVTLRDFNLIEDTAMDVDDDDGEGRPNDDAMDVDDAREDSKQPKAASSGKAGAKNGRRLSNKKLRKKVKMMKKQAAARAAAEALANQKAHAVAEMSSSAESASTAASDVPPPKRTTGRSSNASSSSGKKKAATNPQVAVAQETLAAYREEVQADKAQRRKARAVSIDVQS